MKNQKINNQINNLPHISRIITERIISLLPSLLFFPMVIFILALNLAPLITPMRPENTLKNSILKAPFSFQPHYDYANFLVAKNKEEAEREFRIAETFYLKSGYVLGVNKSPISSWVSLLNRRSEIESEINQWLRFKKTYPDYYYANLKLASLYFENGLLTDAESYALKAIEILPSNNESLELLAYIRKEKGTHK